MLDRRFIRFRLFLLLLFAISFQSLLAQNCECVHCHVPCSAPASSHTNPLCNVVKNRNASAPKIASTSPTIEQMVIEEIYARMISDLFKPANNTQEISAEEKLRQQREEELNKIRMAEMMERQRRYNDSIAQARHDRMMKDYKPLNDSSQGVAYKTLEKMTTDYKSLEGNDLEQSAELARKQFEESGEELLDMERRHPTHFFGDDMSNADLMTLADSDLNSEIVDLRESSSFLEENIQKDNSKIVELLREHDPEGIGEPINEDVKIKIDCNSTARTLSGYYKQREQLYKSVKLSYSQYENWSESKDEALNNAMKDGLAFFLGNIFTKLENRGKAANRLQSILTTNKDQLVQSGVDIAQLEAKINRLRLTAQATNIKHYTAIDDWTTFMKDGFSALIIELNVSNEEINEMMNDPKLEKFFNAEAPFLNTLLDITSLTRDYELFGKALAKKIPQFAFAQLAINTTFNAAQWLVSYKYMVDAENINGKLLIQSQEIQNRINELSGQLMECSEPK